MMDATPLTDRQYSDRILSSIKSMTDISAVEVAILSDGEDQDAMSMTMWHLEANGIGHWLDTADRAKELFEKCDGFNSEYNLLHIFDGAIAVTAQEAFRAVEAALGIKGLENFLEEAGFYRQKDEMPDKPPPPMGAEALVKALTTDD